jgi:hypothetical protein
MKGLGEKGIFHRAYNLSVLSDSCLLNFAFPHPVQRKKYRLCPGGSPFIRRILRSKISRADELSEKRSGATTTST